MLAPVLRKPALSLSIHDFRAGAGVSEGIAAGVLATVGVAGAATGALAAVGVGPADAGLDEAGASASADGAGALTS
jgi:hypothetical protein